MPASKKDLLPQARALYAQGLSLGQVAEALAVSPATTSRWKSADAKSGVSWADQRQARARKDPHALLTILEQQRQDLVESGDSAAPDYADRLWKLQRVIGSVRSEFRDISTAVGVLEDYALYLHDHASDDDLARERVYIEGYLDHLKREAIE